MYYAAFKRFLFDFSAIGLSASLHYSLRQTRLVLGFMIVCRHVNHLGK